MLLDGKSIERVNSVDGLSKGQIKVWKELEGKSIKLLKIKKGKGLECELCGKKSRVENSIFVEVEGKKGKRLVAQGCLKLYYGIELKESNGGKRKELLSKF